MIEVLTDMPDGVAGIRVSGRLSGEDFRSVEATLKRAMGSDDIRIVEVIASDYAGFGPGGLAADLKLGLGTVLRHYADFTRLAVVTDKEWVIHTLHALAWMVPGELRLFGLAEIEDAKQWAAGSA